MQNLNKEVEIMLSHSKAFKMLNLSYSVSVRKIMLYLLREIKTNGIQDSYVSDICRKTHVTLSNAFSVIKEMQKANILETEKKGRIRFVRLTDIGLYIAEKMKEIEDALK